MGERNSSLGQKRCLSLQAFIELGKRNYGTGNKYEVGPANNRDNTPEQTGRARTKF